MNTIRTVVETFIRLVKAQIDPNAVLVLADDIFEVTDVPSVILQGPTLTENSERRTLAKVIEKNVASLTYEESNYPRLYHLNFDVIVTTGNEADLLDLQEKVARFYLINPELAIDDQGALNITEIVPLGGLKRVNLSNLKQSSGRCRIEDCPVYDGLIQKGRLIRDRKFEFRGAVNEERTYHP